MAATTAAGDSHRVSLKSALSRAAHTAFSCSYTRGARGKEEGERGDKKRWKRAGV